MDITVISRSWPSHEKSGVSLVAAEHVRLLLESGHNVSIIGSHKSVLNESFCINKRYVSASGSGAIYSPAKVNYSTLRKKIIELNPELIIVEAWQTALTDTAIDIAHSLKIPILMISHGVSIHPFSCTPLDLIRSLAWSHYKYYFLPNRIRKISVITTLDAAAKSNRFYDREIANRLGIPVIPLVNSPINYKKTEISFSARKPQILVIGYFSYVKNQLAAINILKSLPSHLYIRFIGKRSGKYYEKCHKLAHKIGLHNRVIFSQDNECDVSEEISSSLVVFSTSITEALPVTLIEAMASSTPFVATSVGAVPSLSGGILANNATDQKSALIKITSNENLWSCFATSGREYFLKNYTTEHVKNSLLTAIDIACCRNKG